LLLLSRWDCCCFRVVAFVSEKGPGFSPDIIATEKGGLQPPGALAENFCVLNGGIVIVARDYDVEASLVDNAQRAS
jgi:hypothetical protein